MRQNGYSIPGNLCRMRRLLNPPKNTGKNQLRKKAQITGYAWAADTFMRALPHRTNAQFAMRQKMHLNQGSFLNNVQFTAEIAEN
jgi:hypothetical protein